MAQIMEVDPPPHYISSKNKDKQDHDETNQALVAICLVSYSLISLGQTMGSWIFHDNKETLINWSSSGATYTIDSLEANLKLLKLKFSREQNSKAAVTLVSPEELVISAGWIILWCSAVVVFSVVHCLLYGIISIQSAPPDSFNTESLVPRTKKRKKRRFEYWK